tara:strand:- start:2272 stop:3384 length:1113 start_codon:yes stop_codon:yes gene_type:complete
MSSIQKVERKSGMRYKAVIKRGSRVLKTKTFTKQSNAKSWIRRMESDLEVIDALGMKGARLTLSDLTTLYLDQWTGKDTSHLGKVRFWAEQLGNKYLPDITTDHIREVLNDYAKGYALRWDGSRANTSPILITTNRVRKPATVNRMKACISAIFKFAIQDGYIKANPVSGVSNKREDNKRVRYLSEDERTRLLEAARASDWDKMYLLILMAICTGARKSEMLRLKWQDVDFGRRQALLHQTKNGEKRVLTLPHPVFNELIKFRGIGLIFPSSLKPWQPKEIKKLWGSTLKKANLLYPTSDSRYFRFHDLRHTAASYLVMNGATLFEAGEVLGHKSVETTKRYAHLSVEHKQNLTDRVFGSITGEHDGPMG